MAGLHGPGTRDTGRARAVVDRGRRGGPRPGAGGPVRQPDPVGGALDHAHAGWGELRYPWGRWPRWSACSATRRSSIGPPGSPAMSAASMGRRRTGLRWPVALRGRTRRTARSRLRRSAPCEPDAIRRRVHRAPDLLAPLAPVVPHWRRPRGRPTSRVRLAPARRARSRRSSPRRRPRSERPGRARPFQHGAAGGAAAWPDRWTELVPRPVSSRAGSATTRTGAPNRLVGHPAAAPADEAAANVQRLQASSRHCRRRGATGPSRRGDRGGRPAARSLPCGRTPGGRRLRACADRAAGGSDDSPPRRCSRCSTAIAARQRHGAGAVRARAGLVSHGLSLAHTHVRLNAAQLHNVMRQRSGIADTPEDPAHRRRACWPRSTGTRRGEAGQVDFGALLAEQTSAMRLMMTVAQIVKHIDASGPCAS